MLLEGNGNCRFTAGREASEPERKALLAAKFATLLVGHGGCVPCYVADANFSMGSREKGVSRTHLRRHYGVGEEQQLKGRNADNF